MDGLPRARMPVAIEPDSGAGSTTVREIDFIVNPSDETDLAVALVPGGRWAYASTETSGGRVIRLGSGAISRSSLLAAASGVAADGRLLFGRDIREQRGRVAIFALDAYGGATDFGSIAWPEGALTSYRVIPVINLIVALPPE